MRFELVSRERPARGAKLLKKVLNEAGYELKLSQSQELIARMLGYRNWNELVILLGRTRKSPSDSDVEEPERERRRVQHIQVLLDAGIREDVAASAIDAVKPTNPG